MRKDVDNSTFYNDIFHPAGQIPSLYLFLSLVKVLFPWSQILSVSEFGCLL